MSLLLHKHENIRQRYGKQQIMQQFISVLADKHDSQRKWFYSVQHLEFLHIMHFRSEKNLVPFSCYSHIKMIPTCLGWLWFSSSQWDPHNRILTMTDCATQEFCGCCLRCVWLIKEVADCPFIADIMLKLGCKVQDSIVHSVSHLRCKEKT